MKNWKILIILALLSVKASAGTITPEQRKQVNTKMDGFIALFTQYCQGGKNTISKRNDLLTYFISFDAPHIKDYEETEFDDYEAQPITTYLHDIEEKYQLNFDMHIIRYGLLDCTTVVDSDHVAIYYLEKSVKYGNKFFTCADYILITLPANEQARDSSAYKITEVISATDFKLRNLDCSNLIKADKNDSRKLSLKNYATQLFLQANYNEALEHFVQMLERSIDYQYAKTMINSCRETQIPDITQSRIIYWCRGRRILSIYDEKYGESVNT